MISRTGTGVFTGQMTFLPSNWQCQLKPQSTNPNKSSHLILSYTLLDS